MIISERFIEATVYAVRLHRDQSRKISGEPYVAHLFAAAALVMEYGGSEDEAIAALLHDAAEDQGGEATLQDIRKKFGDDVAAIVEGCTDTKTTPKPPWRERKERFLNNLNNNASPSVILVCAADKLHNARSLLRDYRRWGETLWASFHGGRDGTLWYYRRAAELLISRDTTGIARELSETVSQLESLANEKNR